MTQRRVNCFFYGLFMDEEILAQSNVRAINPRRAFVQDYGLYLGNRATLGRADGAKAYGIVFEVTHEELERLYGGPGLEGYLAETVTINTLEGGSFPALCYNLAAIPEPQEANPDYAAKLRATLERLGFPPGYVSRVR